MSVPSLLQAAIISKYEGRFLISAFPLQIFFYQKRPCHLTAAHLSENAKVAFVFEQP